MFFSFASATARALLRDARVAGRGRHRHRLRPLRAPGRHHHADLDRPDRRQRELRRLPRGRLVGRDARVLRDRGAAGRRRTPTASSTSTSAPAARRRSCRRARPAATVRSTCSSTTSRRDGTRVFFETEEQLVAGDTDSQADVYERVGRRRRRWSPRARRATATSPPCSPASREDGTRVFFETEEQLIAGRHRQLVRRVPAPGRDHHADVDGPDRRQRRRSMPRSADPRGTATRVFFQTDEALSAADTDTSTTSTSASASARRPCLSAPGNGAFPATFVGQLRRRHARLLRDPRGAGRRRHRHVRRRLRAVGRNDRRSCRPARRATAASTPASPGTRVDGDARVLRDSRAAAAGDTDTAFDVYERTGGTTTTRLSTGPAGGNGAIDAFFAGASLDGDAGDRRDDRVAGRQRHRHGQRRLRALRRHDDAHLHRARRAATRRSRRSSPGISDAGLRIFFDTRESLLASDTDTARDVYVADVAGYARPQGRDVRSARRSCPPSAVHGAEPHARAAARVRVVQPAGARVEPADGRHARRPTARSANAVGFGEVQGDRRRARRRGRLRRVVRVQPHRRPACRARWPTTPDSCRPRRRCGSPTG